MSSRTCCRVAALLALLMMAVPAWPADAPPAPAKEMGDSWEVTSQMSMEGMPMSLPARTSKVCSPKEWKEAPVAGDESHKCKNSDFKTEGAKVTWKTVCEGNMTGLGEITRTGDAYTGSIKFTTPQGSMTTKLSGKRLGDCEIKK